MKIQERPPELDGNPCPACGRSQMAILPDARHPSLAAAPDSDRTILAFLESENSSLRRLVVELLEKNQQLRDQLQGLTTERKAGTAGDLHLVSGRTA